MLSGRLLALCGVLVISINACAVLAPSQAPVLYVPDQAGIVAEKDTDGPGERYVLVGGKTVDVAADTIYLNGDPEIGDLLLAGHEPSFWVNGARAGESLPACYPYFGQTRATATEVFKSLNDAMLGDVVIVFPKAEGWRDQGYVQNSDVLLGGTTCVNDRGEATEQRF